MDFLINNMVNLKSDIKIGNQTCGIEIECNAFYMQANFWCYAAYNETAFNCLKEQNELEKALRSIPIAVLPVYPNDEIIDTFKTLNDEVQAYVNKLSLSVPNSARFIRFDQIIDIFIDQLSLNKARFSHICNLKGLMTILSSDELSFCQPVSHTPNTYFIPLLEDSDNEAIRLCISPCGSSIASLDVVLCDSNKCYEVQATSSYILDTINERFRLESNFELLKKLIVEANSTAALN